MRSYGTEVRIVGQEHEGVLVPVDTINVWIGTGIGNHVGEGPVVVVGIRIPSGSGTQHGAAVGQAISARPQLFAIEIGTEHEHRVRMSFRGVDGIVIPALPGAVAVACVTGIADFRAGQVLPARTVHIAAGQRRGGLVHVVIAPDLRGGPIRYVGSVTLRPVPAGEAALGRWGYGAA